MLGCNLHGASKALIALARQYLTLIKCESTFRNVVLSHGLHSAPTGIIRTANNKHDCVLLLN